MPDNKCKWKPEFFTGYECNEPALPDGLDSYCILHSKNEDKEPKDFTRIVENRLKGTKTRWGKEEIDLRGCYFPKKFPRDFFKNRNFDKPVYFSGATFSQEADFYRAKFEQEADFSGATFSQVAFFIDATFSQAYFRRATFSQKAYFGRATFSQAYFGGATFSQAAYFGMAKFSQVADFIVATFSQKAYFNQVEFMDRTFFQYIHSPGEIIFQDVDLSRCSFLHSNIDKVDFRYCTFGVKKNRPFRIIRVFLLKCVKALLGEIKPQVFRIVCSYILAVTPFLRRNVLRDELDWDKEVKGAKDKKKAREGYEPVRRVYLELKRNFEDKKDWNTAGDFHFGEMECRRKMKGWFGRHLLSLEAPYRWASGYGERPMRAFLILLGFILIGFPFGYWLSGSSFSASIWDSVQVATLMRLGNPLESGVDWGKRIVAVLEIVFVPIQTALLVLALRRKVKR